MRLRPFALERYFARHEFTAGRVLCASDIECLALREVLELADDETRMLWDSLPLGYTQSPGHPLLRTEVASMYEGMTGDFVLTFAGAQEAIFLTAHAVLEPGDHVVVVTPTYQSLIDIPRSIGAAVTPVPLETGSWSLDVGRLHGAVRPNTRLVVINFPHSPTGAHLPVDDFVGLATWCESRGIYLLSDEVYRFLEGESAARLPSAVEVGERTITLGVLSKAFGLAGLRIGWVACRDAAILARMSVLKDYTTICNSAPSEILGLIALRAREILLRRSRSILSGNLARLDAFFARQVERVTWVRPRAGTVCFPRLVRGNADEFADDLLTRTGVLILPGSVFDYDPAHFRVGFGRADMAESLARFEEFLDRHLD